VLAIRIDRPPVLGELADAAAAIVATFGVPDDVLLEAIFGGHPPTGRLPIEIPRSMAAVEAAPEDVPGTENPLFERGHGLRYGER